MNEVVKVIGFELESTGAKSLIVTAITLRIEGRTTLARRNCKIGQKIREITVAVGPAFLKQIVKQVINAVDVSTKLNRVIPRRERNGIGKLQTLLVRVCLPFKEVRLTERDDVRYGD